MKHKSKARMLVQNFVNLVYTQFEVNVKSIRTNNGQEFNILDFYSFEGILYQTTCIYTPQQNSVIERKHQYILQIARSLMLQVGLPLKFWMNVFYM